MAGSYNHCVTEDNRYRGVDLLENMGDMREAVDEMFFIIRHLAGSNIHTIKEASDAYYKCMRGEEDWPSYMYPGIDSDDEESEEDEDEDPRDRAFKELRKSGLTRV